jgi:hypothetical protein
MMNNPLYFSAASIIALIAIAGLVISIIALGENIPDDISAGSLTVIGGVSASSATIGGPLEAKASTFDSVSVGADDGLQGVLTLNGNTTTGGGKVVFRNGATSDTTVNSYSLEAQSQELRLFREGQSTADLTVGTDGSISIRDLDSVNTKVFNSTIWTALSLFAEGTWSPTITEGTNVAASTTAVCQYTRIGARVICAGRVNIDPTAGDPTATDFELSLPIASNFALVTDLSGTGTGSTTTTADTYKVTASVANDTAVFNGIASQTAAADVMFTFMYLVI